MGISGFVSNIDLFTCALQVFRHNDFVIRTSRLKFIGSESSVSNRLLTLLSHLSNALFYRESKFDSLLSERIDILSIEARVGYLEEKELQFGAFFDSLERLHESLNNLEEHLHADTNSYLVVGFDLVVPNKYFILPTILASSALLLPVVWKVIQTGEGVELSFFASFQAFLLASIAYLLESVRMNFHLLLLLKTAFFLLVPMLLDLQLACMFFGVLGLLLTFAKVNVSLLTLAIPLLLLPRFFAMEFTAAGSSNKG